MGLSLTSNSHANNLSDVARRQNTGRNYWQEREAFYSRGEITSQNGTYTVGCDEFVLTPVLSEARPGGNKLLIAKE